MPVEQLFDVPRFSLAERDRRWAAVRGLMGEKDIDCLVAPNNTGHSMHFEAEARWGFSPWH